METRVLISHDLLVGRSEFVNFSVILVYHLVLYPLLPSGCVQSECPLLLFVRAASVFINYTGLFVHDHADHTCLEIALTISESIDLAAVQFLLYVADGAAPDYQIGS